MWPHSNRSFSTLNPRKRSKTPRFFWRVAGHTHNQSPDGSWQREQSINGGYFGQCYTTSLSVMALTPAYQPLPIYQR